MKIGDKVHYTSPNGIKENGIIKAFNDSATLAWVVYHCNDDWDKYYDYTGAQTNIKDLTEGWIEEDNPIKAQ